MTEQEHIGSVAMGDTEAFKAAIRNEIARREEAGYDARVPLVGPAEFNGWTDADLAAALSTRPAQEPVAWRKDYSDEYHKFPPEFCDDPQLAEMWRGHPSGFIVTPLYAAPQPAHGTSATERVPAEGATYTQAECDELCDIAERDGYSDAVQKIDQLTGGDGEYRYCLGMEDDERHTPDPATMIQRIVDRFEVLNLLDDATKTGRDQPDDTPSPAPNAVTAGQGVLSQPEVNPVTAGQGVEVKPLEWEDKSETPAGWVIASKGQIGTGYTIEFELLTHFVCCGGREIARLPWDALEAAKAAAQADYERRILSALCPLSDIPAQAENGHVIALGKIADMIDDENADLDDAIDIARLALAPRFAAVCQTCNGTGKEGRHSICRDCDEPPAPQPSSRGIEINAAEVKALLYGVPQFEFSQALTRLASWLAERDDTAPAPALSQQPLSVQEGWKLVPVEPTEAMVDAWQQSIDSNSGFNLRVWTPEANAPFECWKAMLAAAPAHPTQCDVSCSRAREGGTE